MTEFIAADHGESQELQRRSVINCAVCVDKSSLPKSRAVLSRKNGKSGSFNTADRLNSTSSEKGLVPIGAYFLSEENITIRFKFAIIGRCSALDRDLLIYERFSYGRRSKRCVYFLKRSLDFHRNQMPGYHHT